jgi:hypothetical protein
LNGKDIKKVMNNATHLFDAFTAIFKEGKREGRLLSDADIDTMGLHFREVYVLWDGAFALARMFNPTNEDAETNQTFVSAAVQSSGILGCPITPKVHTMLRHVEWQMKNIPGGLGDKMEDWVERLHQWGMQQHQRFRTVQNPLVRAMAREKASSRNTHPDVLAQVEATDEGNKRKLSENNEVDILSIKQKMQRKEGRIKALEYFEEFLKEEKLTWVEIIFNDVKGGGEKNGISPSIPTKQNAADIIDNV